MYCYMTDDLIDAVTIMHMYSENTRAAPSHASTTPQPEPCKGVHLPAAAAWPRWRRLMQQLHASSWWKSKGPGAIPNSACLWVAPMSSQCHPNLLGSLKRICRSVVVGCQLCRGSISSWCSMGCAQSASARQPAGILAWQHVCSARSLRLASCGSSDLGA